ncbi:hypothetical protein [Nostoc sp. KVJ20]|nr:hypothetical protein [Nostoc sp. KVJ20]
MRSLFNAALDRKARYSHRDYTLMLMMSRHGLRVGKYDSLRKYI